MSKVFTAEEFIKKLYWLANEVSTVYHSGKGWSTLNSNGKWMFDCVVSIKSILWGFKADKNLFRGGTIYCSNSVADFTCNGGVEKYSTDVSRDFSKLVPGEYLCMKGTANNHSGVYLGDGKVFECTAGWNTWKCIISEINNKGERFYKGVKNSASWTYHGKLIYIDYPDIPDPPIPAEFKIGDKVIINGDLYVSSMADKPSGYVKDKTTYITRYAKGTKHPYNTTGDLGWMDTNDIKLAEDKKNYIVINTTCGVWCRTGGYGFKYPKYKVIPYKTKCELLQKNVGKSDGYWWDKIIYDNKIVYIPNNWNDYVN